MKFKMILLYLALLFANQTVVADETSQTQGLTTWKQILLMEGLFSVNSYWASKTPHTFGAVAVIASPFAMQDSKKSRSTGWFTFGLFESLAIYNLSINEDKKSEREIFTNNMIGWQVFVGLIFAKAYFSGELDETATTSLVYVPMSDGAQILYRYNF